LFRAAGGSFFPARPVGGRKNLFVRGGGFGVFSGLCAVSAGGAVLGDFGAFSDPARFSRWQGPDAQSLVYQRFFRMDTNSATQIGQRCWYETLSIFMSKNTLNTEAV
jgi:hypothetical protein